MPKPLGLTTFHLVRHAAHGLLGHTLAGRTPGVALSAEGRGQAARLADTFASRPITAVVSSPVQRAQETAGPIAGRLGVPVLTDDGLDELDFGDWTGLAFADLQPRPAWQAWNRARSFAPCPGGEGMVAAQSRALASIARLRAAYPGEELVLVSHQDIIKAVLAHFLGCPLDLFHRLTLDPASRSVLAVFEDDARVDGVNLAG